MKCPHCNHDKFVVKETRLIDGDVVRRRQCGECGGHFGTRERIDLDIRMRPRKKQVRKAPKPASTGNPLFVGV